jgi:hypothetical protein
MQPLPFSRFAHVRKTDLITPPESIGHILLHIQEVRRESRMACTLSGDGAFV